MSQVENQSMSDLLPVEKLLEVIGAISDTNYSRYYLKQYGFDTGLGWKDTQSNILEQFSGKRKAPEKATYSNLVRITKALMYLGKHYCELFTITDAEHQALLKNAINFKFDGKPYSESFPLFVEQKKLTMASLPVLTSIENKKSGLMFYFSTPRKIIERVEELKKVDGILRQLSYKKEIKKQFIDTVFVPHDYKRIEFRISTDVGKRDIEHEMEKLQDVFVKIISANGIKLKDTNPVNLNNAITSIYDDSSIGRVVDCVFYSHDNGISIPRTCRKEVDVCLRDQEYHLAGAEKEEVECVAVTVRWEQTVAKLKLKIKTQVSLESMANFNYTFCRRFIIDNPKGLPHSISLISMVEQGAG
ncbi:hypothetical protein ES815_22245 [Leclercia adecarboxylata]|uniref:Uncharacterized protein n=1 Tax=Leclercia adecarboxylata TaxID=83655 RepID=A0AAP9DDI1_9ENTR|nr:hypothetical protein [Leclercia adecarboxylata]QDK20884.1 hypothetical protein ES815_22245 [Leclercia adecarboxylata]